MDVCHECEGNGVCQECDGSGFVSGDECDECGGTGDCSACDVDLDPTAGDYEAEE